MNSKTVKKIRKKASESTDPRKAYKILKQMYIKGNIRLIDLVRLKLK